MFASMARWETRPQRYCVYRTKSDERSTRIVLRDSRAKSYDERKRSAKERGAERKGKYKEKVELDFQIRGCSAWTTFVRSHNRGRPQKASRESRPAADDECPDDRPLPKN